jgi:hypothetical protein
MVRDLDMTATAQHEAVPGIEEIRDRLPLTGESCAADDFVHLPTMRGEPL